MTGRERVRWFVARQADRSKRFCWSNLVTWAMSGYRSPQHLWECKREWVCRLDVEHVGGCYCGKFRNGCSSSTGEGAA